MYGQKIFRNFLTYRTVTKIFVTVRSSRALACAPGIEGAAVKAMTDVYDEFNLL